MGEGSHFYKIKGKYYIVSAIPGAHVPMKCARADKLAGPWEVDDHQRGREPGNRPGLPAQGQPPPESAVRTQSAGPRRAPQPRPAPGRDHRNAVGRMVGLFDAGPQLRRPPDLALPGHLEGRLALFRPAREPEAHAFHLGEAEHRARRRRSLLPTSAATISRGRSCSPCGSGIMSRTIPSGRSPSARAISACIRFPPPISGGRETR